MEDRGVSCAQHVLVDTELLLEGSRLWQDQLPELFSRQKDAFKNTHKCKKATSLPLLMKSADLLTCWLDRRHLFLCTVW